MEQRDFDRLKESLQEMVNIELNAAKPSKKYVYSGKVLTRIEENENTIWTIQEAAQQLPDVLKADMPTSYSDLIKKVRGVLQQSQDGFAELLNIPLATLQGWEQGRRTPGAAATTLLKITAMNPLAVLESQNNDFAFV